MTLEKQNPAPLAGGNRAKNVVLSQSEPTTATRRSQHIDFASINRAALACFGPVLWRLIPGGKVVAGEYIVRNPTRRDATPGSFKVRVTGPRAGMWADFATGARGGDPVSLCGYLEGVSQGEAARRLGRMLGIESGGRRRG
jgi:hypothetical protein